MKAAALQILREAEASVLIPGHDRWHPLDGVSAPEYVPEAWIGPHVGLRLVEAFKTLAALPAHFGPQLPHNFWPRYYRHEWEDLLAQQEAAQEDKQLRAEAFNRARIMPSRRDVGHMEIALVWPARYLRTRPIVMRVVQCVACWRARGVETEHIARRLRQGAARVRAMNRNRLDLIAHGLRRDGVGVF
jgi:hypothetical protein